MKMKSVRALMSAMAMFGSAFAADTWYVDDDNFGKGGLDGTTPETAYGTIQQAVDAAHAGDAILVLPGTYAQTTKESTGFVVKIENDPRYENLTIRSTGGRDVTTIVGRPATGDDPHGDSCLGGLYCGYTSAGAAIVDGFTFSNCYSRATAFKGRGSACLGYSGKIGALHVYNCRVVSSVGMPFYGVTVHSTIVDGATPANDPENGSVFGQVNADNCLITRARGEAIAHNARLVNCTLVGNSAHMKNGATTGVYAFNNSVLSLTPDCTGGYYPTTNSVSSGSLAYGKSANVYSNVASTNIFACVNGFADYRLRSDSVAVGLADGAALTTQVPLVPADRDPPDEPGRYSTYHDVYGNAIDVTRPFNAGAIQETVAVDDSAVAVTWFKQAYKEPLVIDGETFIGAEAFIRTASASPMQWCVTTAEPETKPLSAVQDSLANLYRMAGSNGTVWVTSAPVGQTRILSVETAQKIFYMDPEGNDAWDGLSSVHEEGTSTGPWQTFTNAAARLEAENTTDRLMIRCAEGTYGKGESKHARIPISTTKTRRYHFVGVEGAGRTFVVGAEATTGDLDSNGCGTNAVGIVYNKGATVGFTGFTFTGGRSDTGKGGGRDTERAAFSVIPSSGGLNLCESVVTNNLSSYNYVGRSPYGYELVFERCRIADNGTTGCSGFTGALLFGCVSVDNRCEGGSWFYRRNSVAVNTTFVRRALAGNQFYTDKELHVYNSIISDFNSVNYFQLADAVGCVYDNSKINANTDASKNTLANAAMYVDKTGGDYRILSCSPAVGAARMDGAEYLKYVSTDFLNSPVCRGAAPVVSGAFTVPLASAAVYMTDPNGYLLADGEKADGAHFIPEGGELTVSANTASSTVRPVIGITVNGVTNLFTGTAGTIAIPFAAVKDTTLAIEPVLGDTWYVNAGDDAGWATGSDVNLGWGRWTPFRTIQTAVDAAADGDVIILAPGVYSEGGGGEETEKTRVYIKNKSVTIRSEQGAAKTVILGADAEESPNEYGCGAKATRCVWIKKDYNYDKTARTRLEGLSLSGGRTAASTGYDDSASGSAVRYENKHYAVRPTIVDCIITNCNSSCSAVLGCRLERCRFVDCTSVVRGILKYCLVYDTVFSRLTAKSDNNDLDGCEAWNITWLPDNFKAYGSGSCPCVNSLIYGNGSSSASSAATNCVFTGNLPSVQKDCRKIAADQWFLDAEGRPIVGQSPLVDAGWDGARALEEDALDASGRPRVMNGRIDIGALEADWNPIYSTRLGRGVTVTAASPSVVTNMADGVSLGANGTLGFDWTCEAGQKCEIRFNVTGTGTLVLVREGAAPVAYTAGVGQVHAFTPDATGVQTFTLTYVPGENDTGTAEILRAKRNIGMVLIFR